MNSIENPSGRFILSCGWSPVLMCYAGYSDYRSQVANDAVNTPEAVQPALWLLSVGVDLGVARCRCDVSFFGRNFADRKYFASGAANSASNGTAEVIMARPREWDLRLGYRFG